MPERTKLKDLASNLGLTLDELHALANEYGIALSKDPESFVGYRKAEKIWKFAAKQQNPEYFISEKTSSAEELGKQPNEVQLGKDDKTLKICKILDIGDFERNNAAYNVLIHKEIAEAFDEESDAVIRRRMSLIAQQLSYSGRSHKSKGIVGQAKGWRRAPCSGNHGNHFYLYWAPKGAQPVRNLDLKDNEVVLRVRRHHDDTNKPLDAGKRNDYFIFSPKEFDKLFGRALNDDQLSFIQPAEVGILKGLPGSGKTTTLWELATRLGPSSILYLTFSEGLKNAADEFFRSFGNSKAIYDTLTFSKFYTKLARGFRPSDLPAADGLGEKTRIDSAAKKLWQLLTTDWKWDAELRPWKDSKYELYAELHSNVFGRALPAAFRKINPAEKCLLPGLSYKAIRDKELSKFDLEIILRIAARLVEENQHFNLFQEPAWAYQFAMQLEGDTSLQPDISVYNAVIVDEIQDLTLIEQYLLLSYVKKLRDERGTGAMLYVTGDEGQSVRPTDFDWGEFGEMAHNMLAKPFSKELLSNVRCPRSITEVINNSWKLYWQLSKCDKPQGYSKAEIEEVEPGRILYCAIKSPRERESVFRHFKTHADVMMVYPGHIIPEGPIKEVLENYENLLTAEQAKGLEFHTVAVLDAGKSLVELDNRLKRATEKGESHNAAIKVWARNLIDSFRVSISRATDTLVLLDTSEKIEYSMRLVNLCGDVAQFNQVDAQYLLDAIRQEDIPRADIARKFADQARRIIEREPFVALRQAKNAISKLPRMGKKPTQEQRRLRKEVYVIAAEASFALAKQKQEEMHGWTPEKLWKQAREYLDNIGLENDIKAITRLEACCRSQSETDLVVGLGLSSKEATLLFVKNACDIFVLEWIKSAAGERISNSTKKARQSMIEAALKIREIYSDSRNREITEYLKAMKLQHADRLKDEHDYAAAEIIYEEYGVNDRLAACKESRGHNPEAARIYEEIGQLKDALRCYRKDARIDDALRIAKALEDSSFAHLSTLKSVHELLRKLDSQHSSLTESERRLANKLRKAASMDELPTTSETKPKAVYENRNIISAIDEPTLKITGIGSVKKSYNIAVLPEDETQPNRKGRRRNKKRS